MNGTVTAVSIDAKHRFSKSNVLGIQLMAGVGVVGDAHAGATVKHRSRVARDPSAPNLRQVHLIHAELFDELREAGFDVTAGDLGENITTRGMDLLALPKGTRLLIGEEAIIEVTGLRNPCIQLDQFQAGLIKAVLDRDATGNLIRKAGIMGTVVQAGEVRPGNAIIADLPLEPHLPLQPV
jgi:MOSC domain-containing protein YiiM